MNFYKRHLGDFASHTAHLSQGQVGTYDLLLDWYYTNERPLPADLDDVRRIARAHTREEVRNVAKILADFFTLEADGYHNRRADEEIAAAQHQCAVNRELGKRGGNPKKKAGYNERGILYAVQRLDGGPIKVGITKYPAQRFSQLRSKVGPIQEIARVEVADMGACEAAVFASFPGRLDGEWIDATAPEVLAAIAKCTQPNGQRTRQRSTQAISSPIQTPDSRLQKEQKQHLAKTTLSAAAAVADEAGDPPHGGSGEGDLGFALDEPPSDDAVAHLRAVSGVLVPIPTDMLERCESAYPLVDVRGALQRAALWLEANPKRRPTEAGMMRFVTAWLARDQQRASEAGVRGFQSAQVLQGGRRESLTERAHRLAREGDERDRLALAAGGAR